MEHPEHAATRLMERHPGYVPIILSKIKDTDPDIDKRKYLMRREDPASKFISHVRFKRIKEIKPEEGLYFFTGSVQFAGQILVGQIYDQYKDKDGFLYIQYGLDNSYGNTF